ncbi:MAG: peptide chain release factor 1 [bacterium JZ-2024 1]
MNWRKTAEEWVRRYESLERQFAEGSGEVSPADLRAAGQALKALRPAVEAYRNLVSVERQMADLEILRREEESPEMQGAIDEEIERLQRTRRELETQIVGWLSETRDEEVRDVILEIRAGTGGEEAALFAADLYRMYSRYAERHGWKVTVLDAHRTDRGGFKEITFEVSGAGVHARLRFEGGVHRVQRVPETEASGRIHTSAASVVVLPEASPVDIEIRPDDLEWETSRAGGPGGQYVNKVESAVRVRHIPTGVVVQCREERSQTQNREKALQLLRAKLYAMEQEKRASEEGALRRKMVGTGDRSDKIRTYNFPQNRVTDHRSGISVYRLQDVLDGDLEDIVDSLVIWERGVETGVAQGK